MPYLGNTPSNQAYAPLIDYFSGDANTTVFTLSRPVASEAGILVIVNNVPQQPEDSYGVSGTTLTFTSAPSTGIDNIWVQYTSLITTVIAPSAGTVGISQLSASGTANGTTFLSGNNTWQTVTASGGGGLTWQTTITSNATVSSGNAYPVSTTTQPVVITLPASPGYGNTVQLTDYAGTWQSNAVTVYGNGSNLYGSTSNLSLFINNETVAFVYLGTDRGWVGYSGFSMNSTLLSTYTITYLVVGAGGGGGLQTTNNYSRGGGGGGGLLTSTASVNPGTAYTITIGAGGAPGNPGANTSISTVTTALGGGSGGTTGGAVNGGNGGSGGGGAGETTTSSGGFGTAGQGFAGGTGTNTANTASGGGGGSAQVGFNGGVSTNVGGAGGNGASSSISGTAANYAGGGGGGAGYAAATATAGAGGLGGGGAGSTVNQTAQSGGTNSGGGGGGSSTGGTSGTGGSGIVIISYSGPQRGTGGNISNAAGNTIHTFLTSGTYTA